MPSNPTAQPQRLTETLAWIARGLVVGLLLVAPWPIAMAEWSSQVWLVPVVGAILLLAAIVALRNRLSVGNALVWSLTVVLAVGLLQALPLPGTMWKSLALLPRFEHQVEQLASEFAETENATTPGNASELAESQELSADRVRTELPLNQTLSIHPLQTRATVCVLAMGLAMLVSSIILFRDRQSVTVLFGALSLSGLAIGLEGIYQAIQPDSWTLMNVPKLTSFATFYSRNSAPQFLACCFAATAGLLAQYHTLKVKSQRDKRYQVVYPSVNLVARLRRRIEDFVADSDPFSFTLLLVMVLLFISVLVANSRGGILAFCGSGLTVMLVLALGKQASFSAVVAVVFLVFGTGIFLSSYGLDELVAHRMDSISREAYELDNVRLELWKMAFSQPTCWLLGSGLGTFHFAILPLYEKPQSVWYYHAENVFVELASDAGIVTLLVALSGLAWLVWHLLSHNSHSNTGRSARFACLFGVLAVALQNLVDFSLILPAVFLPAACLAGAYLGTRHQVRLRKKHSRGTRSARSTKKTSVTSGDSRIEAYVPEDWTQGEATHDDRDRYATQRTRHRPGNSQKDPSEEERTIEKSVHSVGLSPAAEHSWSPLPLIVCLVLISAAVGIGFRPLSAFAFAEQLRNVATPESDLAELITGSQESQWANFPESGLQISRWRQDLARQQLQESPRWPAEVNLTMRQSIAHPEFFNTALHESQDPELQSLKEFLKSETTVLQNLADSRAGMLEALAACPLDWRASWGILRSDQGDISPDQRRNNYARILLTCRNNQPVLQASGTHALMIGEKEAGIRIWQQLLPVSPKARSQVLKLVDRFLSGDELVSILPDNPVQRIELAKLASEQPSQLGLSAKIVESIDLEKAISAARFAADWPLIAWCALQKEDIEQEIEARRRAVLADALNGRLNYDLAITLRRAKRPEEALQSVQEALGNAADNPTYRALEEALLEELDNKGTPP